MQILLEQAQVEDGIHHQLARSMVCHLRTSAPQQASGVSTGQGREGVQSSDFN